MTPAPPVRHTAASEPAIDPPPERVRCESLLPGIRTDEPIEYEVGAGEGSCAGQRIRPLLDGVHRWRGRDKRCLQIIAVELGILERRQAH